MKQKSRLLMIIALLALSSCIEVEDFGDSLKKSKINPEILGSWNSLLKDKNI